jgi:hypothetical protein
MKGAVKNSHTPTFFFQAENDFDLSPSKVLAAEMKSTGGEAEIKIYAPFGSTHNDGHSFAYRGSAVWFPDVIAFLQKHCAR